MPTGTGRRLKGVALAAAGLALSIWAHSTGASAAETIDGIWENPTRSVSIELGPCSGAALCGRVLWASETARADALHGSGRELIGMQVLRDFEPVPTGWRGEVYAPDLNHNFKGYARLLDPTRLEAKGCLLGKLFCKRQVWTRISSGPAG